MKLLKEALKKKQREGAYDRQAHASFEVAEGEAVGPVLPSSSRGCPSDACSTDASKSRLRRAECVMVLEFYSINCKYTAACTPTSAGKADLDSFLLLLAWSAAHALASCEAIA